LLERIKLLQEEVASRVAEQSNRLLLLLSVVTVLGLPFTVVSGLFGMNVGGIPFNEEKHGFWIVVGLVAAFTATAIWLMFRWRRK
jgi:zinc transporter